MSASLELVEAPTGSSMRPLAHIASADPHIAICGAMLADIPANGLPYDECLVCSSLWRER